MIWYLTKGNHKWSINPLVRAWLRAGGLTRFMVIAAASVSLSLLATPVFGGMALIFGRGEFGRFMQGLPGILTGGAWIFWVIDAYMDKRTTQNDLKALLASPNVILATRGEYIGGHPQLPHGRFVYLTLGGTLENPQLNIVLPQSGDRPDDVFVMPILDLQKTTQHVVKTGDDTTVNVTLASVTFRAKFLGEQATFKVEYTAQAGRKQEVEITRFLFGNGEIQAWHNYVVCVQAEADTRKPPYGPWKSLPVGKPSSSREPLGKSFSNDVASPNAALVGASTASVPPRQTVGVSAAQSSPPRTERPSLVATAPVAQPKPPVDEKRSSASPAAKVEKIVPLTQQSMGDAVYSVVFSPDGKALAVALASGICLLDAASLVERRRIGAGAEVRGLAFSPDGRMLAAGLSDQTVRIWQYPGGELLKTLQGHADEVWSVAFSPNGEMLASGGDDRVMRLWQASSGVLVRAFQGHKSLVRSVAFSPDGLTLASGAGSGDEAVRLWRISDFTLVRVLEGHKYGVRSMAFSGDGMLLACGSVDRLVRLWRVSDGAERHVLKGHQGAVSSVAFAQGGKVIASGALDGTIRLWRPEDGVLIETLAGHKSEVRSVAFSPDGLALASGAEDGTVLLWGARG